MKKTIHNHASTIVRLYLSSTMLVYPIITLTRRNSSIKKVVYCDSKFPWSDDAKKNAPVVLSLLSHHLVSSKHGRHADWQRYGLHLKVQHHCNAVTDHFLLPLKEYFCIFAGLIWATFCALLWPRFLWRVSGLWIDEYTFWWFTKQAKTIFMLITNMGSSGQNDTAFIVNYNQSGVIVSLFTQIIRRIAE